MRYAIALGLAGLALISLTACDDESDDQLTVEEYFRALDLEDDAYAVTIGEREAEFSEDMEGAETFAEQLESFRDFTADGAGALEDFGDGVDALSPPDDLQNLHDRVVTAMRAGVDSLNDVVSALSDVSTEEEFRSVLMAGGTEETFERMAAACKEAQSAADDAGVDVEFECGEDDE